MSRKISAFLFILLLFGYSSLADENNNEFNLADPGYKITFPKDHGPHKNFRIEWWYLTSNLKSESIENLGIQWTLFKSNLTPISSKKPSQLNGFWMAHSAITTDTLHYFEERFAREESDQAGVELDPFRAWIDNWSVTGDDQLETIQLETSGVDFAFSLKFSTKIKPVLQGNAGYSKNENTEVDYMAVAGSMDLGPAAVTGMYNIKDDNGTETKGYEVVASVGDISVGYGEVVDGDTYITAGIDKAITGAFSVYAEYQLEQNVTANQEDQNNYALGAKVTF